jgi:hypothetical protein
MALGFGRISQTTTPSHKNWRLKANERERRGMVTDCFNSNCARADNDERREQLYKRLRRHFLPGVAASHARVGHLTVILVYLTAQDICPGGPCRIVTL